MRVQTGFGILGPILFSVVLLCLGLTFSPITVAQAKPMDVSVSGYFNTALMTQNFDAYPETPALTLEQDGEIHFKGGRRLDNGIRLGVRVQLEADQNIDQIDEHYVFVQGGFGRFIFGAENSAADLLLQGGNQYLGYRQTRDEFLVNLNTTGYQKTDHSFITGDAPKITYLSPRIAGLRIGLSLTPSTQSITGSRFGIEQSGDGIGDHASSFGLNYKGNYAGLDYALSLGGEYAEEGGEAADGDGTFKDWSMAANAKGKTIGFSFTALTRKASQWGTRVNEEKRFTNLALSYRLGEKTIFGIERQDDEVISGATLGSAYQHVRFGGQVTLADSLKLTFSVLDGSQSQAGQNFDVQIGAVGLLIRF